MVSNREKKASICDFSKRKFLIFSHKCDIDGMGCVVLLKLVSRNVDYVLCENNQTNTKFREYFTSGMLDKYTDIFITDLHLNKENLELINNIKPLKDKVLIFDHNESALKYNSYDFVNIVIENNGIQECATSLFFKYLVENNMLGQTDAIITFCELIRRYDTGTWKHYTDERPRDLSLLFECLSAKKFIKLMHYKLKYSKTFALNGHENYIVESKKNVVRQKVTLYIENIVYKKLFGYNTGIVFIEYEYRNEVAQYIREHRDVYDLDFVMLISNRHNSVSIRNINPEVNVRPIAEKLGRKRTFWCSWY